MIKFRCDRASIERREVDGETETNVVWSAPNPRGFMLPHYERKFAHDHGWFDTWAEAKAHLFRLHQKRVDDLTNQLEEAEISLQAVKRMEEP